MTGRRGHGRDEGESIDKDLFVLVSCFIFSEYPHPVWYCRTSTKQERAGNTTQKEAVLHLQAQAVEVQEGGEGGRGRGRGRGGHPNDSFVHQNDDQEDENEDESDQDSEEKEQEEQQDPNFPSLASANKSKESDADGASSAKEFSSRSRYSRRKLESNSWRYQEEEKDPHIGQCSDPIRMRLI